MTGHPYLVAIQVIVGDLPPTGIPAAANARAVFIVVVRFAQSAAKHLADQLFPGVVVAQTLVVDGAALPDFPAPGVMDIHPRGQPYTKDFSFDPQHRLKNSCPILC